MDETLSTLRYADRAKSIVNLVVQNEDPLARRVRLMQEQIDRLLKELGETKERENEKNSKIQEMTAQLMVALENRAGRDQMIGASGSIDQSRDSGVNSQRMDATIEFPTTPRLSNDDSFSFSSSRHELPCLDLSATETSATPQAPEPPVLLSPSQVEASFEAQPDAPISSSSSSSRLPALAMSPLPPHEDTSVEGSSPTSSHSSRCSSTNNNDSRSSSPDCITAPSAFPSDVPSLTSSPSTPFPSLATHAPLEAATVPIDPITDPTSSAFDPPAPEKKKSEEEGEKVVASAQMSPASSGTSSTCSSPTPSTPLVVAEGFLLKRGKQLGAFSRRYFVLQGNVLWWYNRFGDPDSIRGALKLKGCQVQRAEEETRNGFPFCFLVKAIGEREYCFQASSSEECKKWVKAIEEASKREDDAGMEKKIEDNLQTLNNWGCSFM